VKIIGERNAEREALFQQVAQRASGAGSSQTARR
jgi:hypothetical protein